MKLRPLWDLLYPVRCAGCGRGGDWLCAQCLSECTPHTASGCPRCGARSPGNSCGACSRYIRHLYSVQAAYEYSGPVRDLVHQFKYEGLHGAAEWMAGRVCDAVEIPGSVLVPVPMHPKRQRARRYNQAELLARAIGERSGLPVVRALRRKHFKEAQARLEGQERWLNVRDAFGPGDPLPPGEPVTLVDDVCTTAATLEECAAALTAGGVYSVSAVVFARA